MKFAERTLRERAPGNCRESSMGPRLEGRKEPKRRNKSNQRVHVDLKKGSQRQNGLMKFMTAEITDKSVRGGKKTYQHIPPASLTSF